MRLFFALALAVVLAGCSKTDSDTQTTTGSSPADTSSTSATTGSTAPPPTTATTPEKPPVDRMPKDGEEVAVMETSMGRIVLMFFPDKAPNHVKNFKDLAKKGFYDGTKFHRIIPGFMIQGGDPNTINGDPSTWGAGGPDKMLKGEMNDVHHSRGILSMARTPDPDSAGSQFFIVVADSAFLDPMRGADGKLVPGREGYTVFGQVLSGMDAADKIVALPRDVNDRPDEPPVVKSVKIVKWPVK